MIENWAMCFLSRVMSRDRYLEGKYYWNKRSEKDLLKAIELFAEAAKVDPDYALAYSGLADCYGVLGDHRYLPYLEAFSKQKEYALKAVELDPISAEAHTSLAQSFMNNDRDLVSAANEHEKAIELSPSYATSYHWYGVCLTYLGRPEEALEQSKKAQDLDPLSPQIASFAGLCYLPLGKYDLAERQQFRALDLQPSFVPAITNLRYTYFAEKKYSEAEYENLEYLKVTGDSRGSKFFQAAILANSGRGDEARKTMEEAKASPGFGDFREYQMLYHIGLGEEESAIKLVQLEYDSGAHWLGAITEYPMFTRIRNDPRVKEILRKTGVRVTRE
jgi:Tfp pilus assembly protein PilF